LATKLVIVESPSKAKTIEKFLGPDFEVRASVGHVVDLPMKGLGVDTRRNFAPKYVVIPGKEKVLLELRRASRAAQEVYLAPDPDREGEAIALGMVCAFEFSAGRGLMPMAEAERVTRHLAAVGLPQRLFQLTPLHFALVHASVYISKTGRQRANAPPQRQGPNRDCSGLAATANGAASAAGAG